MIGFLKQSNPLKMIPFRFIFSVPETSKYTLLLLYKFHILNSALINKDYIKEFNSENWKLFKSKSTAPKFKSAVLEARKKCFPESTPSSSKQEAVVVKKRGRPKKLKLLEVRQRLQQLLFSRNLSCTEEIISILDRINKTNDIDKDDISSSKLGNLLKKVFCSADYKVWHTDMDLLVIVKEVTVKIINLK